MPEASFHIDTLLLDFALNHQLVGVDTVKKAFD